MFLRYGFKKTSMDDLARAAGLSRQGLYLYFPTEEALFKAMLAHCFEAMRAAGRDALAREDLNIEDRLLDALVAMGGEGIGSEHLAELLATRETLVGPRVRQINEEFISDVAQALFSRGVASRWKNAGITANDLAEHLFAASVGTKQKVKTPDEYRDRMRIAVQLVCRGGREAPGLIRKHQPTY